MLNPPTIALISQIYGVILISLVSFVGLRFLSYYESFLFHWRKYRQLNPVTLEMLQSLKDIPNIKVQITTRGTFGSTPVIRRGIKNVLDLVWEDSDFYNFISVEVVTESIEQKNILEREFERAPIPVHVYVMPSNYQTPKSTELKSRGLHYMVELRRRGLSRKPGRTFIVHYDEESVIIPSEFRKLIHYLALTRKKLTEGPIYYPLEYREASLLCRAMEANRPVGCFECREVMEFGIPLHMHGSNLVIDEALENELGWDIGKLNDQPFIAEDYVFGMLAFLKYGPEIFGWHGVIMLEQPPFSFKSAFRQRYRWIIGVMQGIQMMRNMSEFRIIPPGLRRRLVWGTRYRVMTFALGLPASILSTVYIIYQAYLIFMSKATVPLPVPIMSWLIFVGFMWLNSVLIGGWYNVSQSQDLRLGGRIIEVLKVIAIAPLSGTLESTAAFWAVRNWTVGKRKVSWNPTPKTLNADKAVSTTSDHIEESNTENMQPVLSTSIQPPYRFGYTPERRRLQDIEEENH